MKNKLEEFGCNIRIPSHDFIWYEDPNNITNNDLLKFLKMKQIKLASSILLEFDDANPTIEEFKCFEQHKMFNLENKLNDQKIYEIENGSDDVGASHHIIKKYNDRIIKCNGDIYVNTENEWVSNDKDVHNTLHNMIADTDTRY